MTLEEQINDEKRVLLNKKNIINAWLKNVYDPYNSQFQTHKFEYENGLITEEVFNEEKEKYLAYYETRKAKLLELADIASKLA